MLWTIKSSPTVRVTAYRLCVNRLPVIGLVEFYQALFCCEMVSTLASESRRFKF